MGLHIGVINGFKAGDLFYILDGVASNFPRFDNHYPLGYALGRDKHGAVYLLYTEIDRHAILRRANLNRLQKSNDVALS